MNIFQKIFLGERFGETRLGCPTPADDSGAFERRMAKMASFNPKGFRDAPKEPRVVRDGKTRGDLKRERRAETCEKVRAEQRAAADSMVERAARFGAVPGDFDYRFGSL